jgi:hypothetical protein
LQKKARTSAEYQATSLSARGCFLSRSSRRISIARWRRALARRRPSPSAPPESLPARSISPGSRRRSSFTGRILSWWDVRLTFGATLYSGNSTDALLAVGAAVESNVGAGTTISAMLGPNFRLGLAVDYTAGAEAHLDIGAPIMATLNAHTLLGTGLYFVQHTHTLQTAILGAFPISPPLGVEFAVEYIHEFKDSSIDRPSRSNDFTFGGMIDVDLRPLAQLPISAVAAYQIDVPLESGNTLEHRANAGAFYTQRHLVLGPELSFRWFDLSLGRNDLPTFSTIVELFFQYTW